MSEIKLVYDKMKSSFTFYQNVKRNAPSFYGNSVNNKSTPPLKDSIWNEGVQVGKVKKSIIET